MTAPAAPAAAPRNATPTDGPRAPRAWTDAAWVVPTVAAAIVLLVALLSITPDPIGVFWDDGVYLLSAKALASGAGYRYTYLPGAPPAIHYPPGFPLLLAALLKVTPAFPANVALLKLLNPLLLAAGVFALVRWLAPELEMRAMSAAIATALCSLIAPVMVLTNVLLSESFFFAVLVVALWLCERAARLGGARRAAAAGVVIAMLALVRTVGGVLLPAAVLAFAWRRRWREAAVLAACAVVALAPWQLWVWQAARGFPDELRGSYGPYLEWVIGGYRRDPSLARDVLVKNAADLWRAFGFVFAPRLPRAVQVLASTTALLVCVAGLVSLARRALTFVLFVVAYAAVVLLWPYNPERFVWAVWPLAGVVLLAGTHAAGVWLRPRWNYAPRAALIVLGVLFAGEGAYAVRGVVSGWGGAPQQVMTRRLWPLVQWSVTHAGPDDVIASDAHVMIALYTGRSAVPVSVLTPAEHVRDKAPAQFAAEMAALDARYHPRLLVLSRGTPENDAVPIFATMPSSPVLTPLAGVPGGGSAYALRPRQ